MKLIAPVGALIAASIAVAMATPASARDTPYHLKIAEVKSDARYAESVPSGVTFYFADQKPGAVGTTIEDNVVANLKTNSVGKSDEEACRWVMLSAMKEMGERAIKEGGNAVINVVSYYKRSVFSSDTDYECHAGAFVAGVALKGTIVKLP
jgi:uncharacterized protein YbjQ (UPF0145 family)